MLENKLYIKKRGFRFMQDVMHKFAKNFKNNRKVAFTLAEVLITIAIVGVVAAMTLPNLQQSYNKHFTEVRLKKFYADFNNAIRLSEIDNGSTSDWSDLWALWGNNTTNCYTTRSVIYKYLKPYMKIQGFDLYTSRPIFILPDGSAFAFKSTTIRDMWYFPKNYKKCISKKTKGVCSFMFQIKSGQGLIPHPYDWDNINLYEKCYSRNSYGSCVEVLRRNNWKFPKEFNLKINY